MQTNISDFCDTNCLPLSPLHRHTWSHTLKTLLVPLAVGWRGSRSVQRRCKPCYYTNFLIFNFRFSLLRICVEQPSRNARTGTPCVVL